MAKPGRSKETGPRGRKASERKLETLQARVTLAAAEQLNAALPGPSASDRLRAMVEDAVDYHREAVDLCTRWTEAQECGDWDLAGRLAAVIAQLYRVRAQELVARLASLTVSEVPSGAKRQEN